SGMKRSVRWARSKRLGLPNTPSFSVMTIRFPCVLIVPIERPGSCRNCARATDAQTNHATSDPSKRATPPGRRTMRFMSSFLRLLAGDFDDAARMAHSETRRGLTGVPVAHAADVEKPNASHVVGLAEEGAIHIDVDPRRRRIGDRRRPSARQPFRVKLVD